MRRVRRIKAQDWSLSPGRYVGVAPGEPDNAEEFKEKLTILQEELDRLDAEARRLQTVIALNAAELLQAP